MNIINKSKLLGLDLIETMRSKIFLNPFLEALFASDEWIFWTISATSRQILWCDTPEMPVTRIEDADILKAFQCKDTLEHDWGVETLVDGQIIARWFDRTVFLSAIKQMMLECCSDLKFIIPKRSLGVNYLTPSVRYADETPVLIAGTKYYMKGSGWDAFLLEKYGDGYVMPFFDNYLADVYRQELVWLKDNILGYKKEGRKNDALRCAIMHRDNWAKLKPKLPLPPFKGVSMCGGALL